MLLINYVSAIFICVGCHLSSLRRTLLIAVGECERTHALHGGTIYPTTSSATSDASVGATQVAPRLVHIYSWGGKSVIIEMFVKLYAGKLVIMGKLLNVCGCFN